MERADVLVLARLRVPGGGAAGGGAAGARARDREPGDRPLHDVEQALAIHEHPPAEARVLEVPAAHALCRRPGGVALTLERRLRETATADAGRAGTGIGHTAEATAGALPAANAVGFRRGPGA